MQLHHLLVTTTFFTNNNLKLTIALYIKICLLEMLKETIYIHSQTCIYLLLLKDYHLKQLFIKLNIEAKS